jgi:hypothetical protein
VFQLVGGDTDGGTTVDISNISDTTNSGGTSSPALCGRLAV